MLKIRLQGTTNELKWFRKILEKNSNFEILSISEPYANKGTNKCNRQIMMRPDIKLPQPFASWSNSL